MTLLIGLAGRAGGGKDTVADALVKRAGFVKYSLAQPLKELLNARFGWTMEDWADREWKECPALYALDRNRIPTHGYSPRQMAQWLGTEILRKFAGPNVWVRLMEEAYEKLRAADRAMVVADVRFDNEAYAIRALGGVVIQLVNPDASAVQAHSSEAGVNLELIRATVVARMGETDKLIRDVFEILKLEEDNGIR